MTRTRILLFLVLLFPLAQYGFVVQQQLNSNNLFHTTWSVKEFGSTDARIAATVPGTIHTDLFQAGKIANPYFGKIDSSLRWIETKTWEYTLAFYPQDNVLACKERVLVFEGLDTYADVYLNNKLILQTDNMFRRWQIDVSNVLRKKENVLRIVFHPVGSREVKLAKAVPYAFPEGTRVYTRKAQFQYGWDFSPRYLTCGIWRNVRLEGRKGNRVEHPFFETVLLNDDSAVVRFTTTVIAQRAKPFTLTIKNEGKKLATKNYDKLLTGQPNTISVTFTIPHPQRWWCNESGIPYRYAFDVEFASPQDTIRQQLKHGLRTLRIVQEKDAKGDGSSFYVELNGKPVFMRGANWVPPDVFAPEAWKELSIENYPRWKYKYHTSTKTEMLLDIARSTHLNMLRVWGGGVYEDDRFYERCDELGILVWQDFMFAGSPYPGDEDFLRSVRAEATDNVLRLRNHCCIALWCGNNEINEGWNNWGWQRDLKYTRHDSTEVWNNYLKTFHQLLPTVVHDLDPQRFYWESSPSGGWGRSRSYTYGDVHYWGVWWGSRDFNSYEKSVGRFVSEYGFQGIPNIASLYDMAGADLTSIDDPRLTAHQKNKQGFATIRKFMISHYKEPESLADYSYVSQVIQADGYEAAIGAHRRAKPYCMGSLFWQWNDPWPGISWSTMDWYLRPKLALYRVEKAYEPFTITTHTRNDSIIVTLLNDNEKTYSGKLNVRFMDVFGKEYYTYEIPVTCGGETTKEVLALTKAALGNRLDWTRGVLVVDYKSTSYPYLMRSLYYGTDFRWQKLETKPVVQQKESCFSSVSALVFNGISIDLKATTLARRVYLSIPDDPNAYFEENGFDMLPGECKTVRVFSNKSRIGQQVVIQTLNDVKWK